MTESFVNPLFGDRRPPTAGGEVQGTGDSDVDAVLDSLRGLDDLPVATHVTLFEQAHESLRLRLAGAGNREDSPRGDPASGRS